MPGLTLPESKLAFHALSELSGLAEADHKLPLPPWSLNEPFQLPENVRVLAHDIDITHFTILGLPRIGRVTAPYTSHSSRLDGFGRSHSLTPASLGGVAEINPFGVGALSKERNAYPIVINLRGSEHSFR